MPLRSAKGIFMRWIATVALLSVAFVSRSVLAADDFDGLRAAIAAANRGSGWKVTLTSDVILVERLPSITGGLTIDGGGTQRQRE